MYVNLRNLVLTIFLVMIEICFGFNSHNVQLCVVRFCFGYCLYKRRPAQVYVEINDGIFRLKKIDAIINQMQNLVISQDSFFGKDSASRKTFYKI